MAINNTGAMFKSFEFDGTDSRDFGVYITGSAVYNAPEREVEMVSIPNRNGAFALDKGRFGNIEITYPAGIYADTEADFAEAISDLRNFLCSKRGYCRLVDEYNPNEYRMAIYKSGLEVEPTQSRAGEFEITFECMPQRFLLSGDDPISITSGDTITNPTLFDSRPLLEVAGYGEIDIDGETLTVNDVPYGDVVISEGGIMPMTPERYDLVNVGDPVRANNIELTAQYLHSAYKGTSYWASNISWTTGSGTVSFAPTNGGYGFAITINVKPVTGAYGTESIIAQGTFDLNILAKDRYYGTDEHAVYRFSFIIKYTAAGEFTLNSFSYSRQEGTPLIDSTIKSPSGTAGEIIGTSSISSLIGTTYINLDIGEVYKIDGGVKVSLNDITELPAVLPMFKPGGTTILYDNTITSLNVIPRWWKI